MNPASQLNDQLARPLKDLRISVIDRCNFRCNYCMPDGEFQKTYKFTKPSTWLSFEEITRLTKIFVQCGVNKVRITGGEPLLREDIDVLIKNLSKINGIEDLTLTTNGFYLDEYASILKRSGLNRLTISLDTLDSQLFEKICGSRSNLQKVLSGIDAAVEAGFDQLKINAIMQKGLNDHTALDLVERFKGSKHILRFIEYMDVGNCNHWQEDQVVTSKELIEQINKIYPIEAIDSNYYGEVATRYRYKDGSGEIGFISSISQPFCGSCTRARLSTDGQFITCLFAKSGIDLRRAIRDNATDEELTNLISSIWQKREDRYSELRQPQSKANSPSQKVEMFQIGG